MRSTLSSPGTSYLDLIRDYAANKQVESELCATANDLPPTSSYTLCSDLLEDRPESPPYKIVSDTLSFEVGDLVSYILLLLLTIGIANRFL